MIRRGCELLTGVDVVFFDAAGTLFDVRGSVGHIYSGIAARHGVTASPDEVNRAFRAAFRDRSARGFMTAAEDVTRAEKEWWFDVVRAVFEGRMPEPVLADYFHEVFEAFRHGEVWRLFPETGDALTRLRNSGCRLGIVSNFDSRLFDVLRDLGIDGYFETVTLSWRAGAAKPDRRIFETAVAAMHTSNRKSVHVGDSRAEDFLGAIGAGLNAIHLDRAGNCAGGGEGTCARNLDEVCRLLGR
jgi:putative hydrolase of the HAD superfamily